jgi:hypothetical protein
MAQRMSLILALIVCLSMAIVPAWGQGKTFGKAGTVEVAGSIAFSSLTEVSNGKTGSTISLLSFGPEIGVFVAPGFELGFNPGMTLLPGFTYFSPEKGEGTTIMQLFVYPAYNLQTADGTAVPFIQVPIGYTAMSSGDYTDSGFSWGVKGGVKLVAGGNMLVTLYGQYLQLSFTPEKATERYGFNYLSFGVSVGGFF